MTSSPLSSGPSLTMGHLPLWYGGLGSQGPQGSNEARELGTGDPAGTHRARCQDEDLPSALGGQVTVTVS